MPALWSLVLLTSNTQFVIFVKLYGEQKKTLWTSTVSWEFIPKQEMFTIPITYFEYKLSTQHWKCMLVYTCKYSVLVHCVVTSGSTRGQRPPPKLLLLVLKNNTNQVVLHNIYIGLDSHGTNSITTISLLAASSAATVYWFRVHKLFLNFHFGSF